MKLITHSEEFHTDDVLATALLLELFPDAELVRSRDEAAIATGDIVYDVGKVYDPAAGRYDHHQEGARKRENGVVYCSFGLLWQKYGTQYCNGDQTVADEIDRRLAVPVDANDNGQKISTPTFDGVEPFTIYDVISIYNPLIWANPDEEPDKQFIKAVALASNVLRRLRDSIANDRIAQKALVQAYNDAEDKRVIVMAKPASVHEVLEQCPELLYVISARSAGNWGVLAVPPEPHSFASRKPFPQAWRAQPADKLAKITGVADATFCHANGFLAVAKSKEGALALAQASLNT